MARPVGGWELSLATQPASAARLPVFLRIARAIAEDARRGRLAAGSRLPGSRELARSLRVHRNTVLAAYAELAAEGYLETSAGRGTYLKRSLPEVKPRRFQAASAPPEASRARLGFAFEAPFSESLEARPPRGAYKLFGGLPDLRMVPREALARAQRRALRLHPELLGYGDPRGEPSLRAALAEMLRARRGLRVQADDIVITRGSQMAVALLGRLLLRPGDVVAVEELGYRPAWRALGRAAALHRPGTDPRASLRPVALDGEGLRVDALEALCEREPVRAVYVTPHHQYPSTVTLSAARRMALLELARRRRIAIIEDDYDHEFHYEGRPVLPLASADDAGVVLYVGTLSKVLAPGLRVGYLVAPEPLREAALALRFDLDRQGDRVGEHALGELMQDGELQRHTRRTRRLYQGRRDRLAELLRAQLGEWLDFEVPAGGMALWVRVGASLPVAPWLARAERLGVFTQPGRQFTFDGRERQRVRMGYAAHTEQELARAVAALRKAALEQLRAPRRA